MIVSMQYVLLLWIFICFQLGSAYAQTPTTPPQGGSPTYKLSGAAEVQSHFVYHGLSQTNKDPAFNGSFWFNFGPQFRLGMWGSNTNYEGTDTHLWMRLNGDIKIDFSQNSDLVIGFSQNQYYKSNSRDGTTISLNFNFFTYHVIYELESNWEGTTSAATYFAFQKVFDVFSRYKWDNRVGYTTTAATGYSAFLDLKTGLGTQLGDIFGELSFTGTSSPSQFNGRGDYFFIFSLRANF